MKNILAVVAHPDDLEMMAGASVSKWIAEGKYVHVLVLTNGSWVGPDGTRCRPLEEIDREVDAVKEFMGYSSYEVLNEETLNLQYKDALVCEVLQRTKTYEIDTLLTSWEHDTHRDHRIACEIAVQAARRVPTFMMGQINYYTLDTFTPNLFVDVTNTFQRKLDCMALYKSQWDRSGKDWTEYLQSLAICNGRVVGTKLAEAFVAKRLIY